MNEGWICPRCGTINAPWKSKCDCTSNEDTAHKDINTYPYNPLEDYTNTKTGDNLWSDSLNHTITCPENPYKAYYTEKPHRTY